VALLCSLHGVASSIDRHWLSLPDQQGRCRWPRRLDAAMCSPSTPSQSIVTQDPMLKHPQDLGPVPMVWSGNRWCWQKSDVSRNGEVRIRIKTGKSRSSHRSFLAHHRVTASPGFNRPNDRRFANRYRHLSGISFKNHVTVPPMQLISWPLL